jgi:FkbM family methyltransferase
MKFLKEIFAHPELAAKPPVLIDIGASTHLPQQWRDIAEYSICIAFDPDRRQMEYIEKEGGFKKLYVFPAIVHATINGETDFFLTASPECSSTLRPCREKLEQYLYAHFFKVEQQIKIRAATLVKVLEELKLSHIDWLKIDSQGTDLRLFKSIPETIRHKTVAVEFEPGIIDAYEGEDKLWQILEFMGREPFWCSEFNVHGSKKITASTANRFFSPLQRKLLHTVLRPAPGWAELAFLNDLSSKDMGIREYLLGWTFAMLQQQYGTALGTAERGFELFGDEIFKTMTDYAANRIKKECLLSPKIPGKILDFFKRKLSVAGKR